MKRIILILLMLFMALPAFSEYIYNEFENGSYLKTDDGKETICQKTDDGQLWCSANYEIKSSPNIGYYSEEAIRAREIINVLDDKRIILPGGKTGRLRISPSGNIEIKEY